MRNRPLQKKNLTMIFAIAFAVAFIVFNPMEALAVGIGDYITFGNYEQDNDLFNGKEPIEWLILQSEGDEVLLMSRYALDCQSYNKTSKSITWQSCTLRTWLNSTFYDAAFSQEEKAAITPHTVWNTVGDSTADYVFLMSCGEGSTLFDDQAERIATATPYALAQGVPDLGGGRCWYWLRDRGSAVDCACYVNSSGMICGKPKGIDINSKFGAVRPLIWVNVSALQK